jgi:predicted signal transduction protein with EAL and GGDEF domain
LQQADAALYQAKSEGRGRFQYFSADLTQAARQHIELEARYAMPSAISSCGFTTSRKWTLPVG